MRGVFLGVCVIVVGVIAVPVGTAEELVWEWTEMSPAASPSARMGGTAVYDRESDRMVLFGGRLVYTDMNDTWEYDCNSDTWTQRSPATSPSVRHGHAMVYDVESDRAILFGGNHGVGLDFDGTWEYDCNSDTWTQRSPVTSPSGRHVLAMAYDTESQRVILFGGRRTNDPPYGDTWAYDYNTDSWIQMSPPTSPTARSDHAMAYVAGSDRVVLFGGHDGTSHRQDTWEYDFNTDTWTEVSPPISPSARHGHTMEYDTDSSRVVLFGGKDASQWFGDTWEYSYETSTWTLISLAGSPPARYIHMTAYDDESRRLILFGGWLDYSNYFGDTWTLRATCFGDLDGDLDIDLSDLAILLANYGMTSGALYEDGDLVGDGDVDLADLAELLSIYGTTCD